MRARFRDAYAVEMAEKRMHGDELEITEAIVRRMLREQFPQWADLPLDRVEPEGTVNAIFRLGDERSVRMPRRSRPAASCGHGAESLAGLAPALPLQSPRPGAKG